MPNMGARLRVSLLVLALLTGACGVAQAQWNIEDSHTASDLRGIDSVGNGIAWASGTNGTVLRTNDGGHAWQTCSVPPGAEKLDLRGILGFDANTAIVMSSGKGDLSRLYKTTDGCRSWRLIFTNPDADGFWDAIYRTSKGRLYVLGDPVKGVFAVFLSDDGGKNWLASGDDGREAPPDASIFAASNSSLTSFGPYLLFGTGGSRSSYAFRTTAKCSPPPGHPNGLATFNCTVVWVSTAVPVASGTPASGVFSLALRPFTAKNGMLSAAVVAVGGAYDHPNEADGSAAFSTDGGQTWQPARIPPHGFRSSVAYDQDLKLWITVGPNGTDASTDDGHKWRAVHPNAVLDEPPNADRNWNALSLPFVVGPHGRIGKLDLHAFDEGPEPK